MTEENLISGFRIDFKPGIFFLLRNHDSWFFSQWIWKI